MKEIRTAMIGCGAIAQKRHIPELSSHPNVKFVAFCDSVIERAQRFAVEYGARAFTDYNEMLSEVKPDAVIICTPLVTHAPAAIAAAQARAHVLVEKPMAVSNEEAAAMIDAAQSRGVYLMVAHNQRFMAPHVKARQILKEGRLGKVLTFRTSFGHSGPENWSIDGPQSWFFRKEEAVMGAMGDLGIHKSDLIRFLLEDEVVQVSSMIDTLDKKATEVEDNAVCLLRMRSGAIGTLFASWTCYQGADNSTILWCENGVMKIGTDSKTPLIVELSNGTVERFEFKKQSASGVTNAFVNSILTSNPPSIDGEEGRKSLQVILAAFESQWTGKTVDINHPRRSS